MMCLWRAKVPGCGLRLESVADLLLELTLKIEDLTVIRAPGRTSVLMREGEGEVLKNTMREVDD